MRIVNSRALYKAMVMNTMTLISIALSILLLPAPWGDVGFWEFCGILDMLRRDGHSRPTGWGILAMHSVNAGGQFACRLGLEDISRFLLIRPQRRELGRFAHTRMKTSPG